MSSASAPRDDAAIPPSVATTRYARSYSDRRLSIDSSDRPIVAREEERNDVIARRTKRMTYSRGLLLAVGSLEACKLLPAHADLAKHPDDAALWVPGGAPGGIGDPELPRRNRVPEAFEAGAGSKSKPCVRFFSTAGCRFGSNCHFIHDIPGGSQAVAETSIPSGPAPAPKITGMRLVNQQLVNMARIINLIQQNRSHFKQV
nr:uncharacterized protein LOC109749962 [Aegilops tauschii subsp. strangulata]